MEEEELWTTPVLLGIGAISPLLYVEPDENEPVLYLPDGTPAEPTVKDKELIGFRMRAALPG